LNRCGLSFHLDIVAQMSIQCEPECGYAQ
jgi:hypothetical protein